MGVKEVEDQAVVHQYGRQSANKSDSTDSMRQCDHLAAATLAGQQVETFRMWNQVMRSLCSFQISWHHVEQWDCITTETTSVQSNVNLAHATQQHVNVWTCM